MKIRSTGAGAGNDTHPLCQLHVRHVCAQLLEPRGPLLWAGNLWRVTKDRRRKGYWLRGGSDVVHRLQAEVKPAATESSDCHSRA
jgi:hypothetical protein